PLRRCAFYRLNAVAAAICRGLARDEPVADIARGLAGTYQITLAQATRDVESVLEQMRQALAPTGVNPIQFKADASGFLLSWQGRGVCHFDARAGVLNRPAGAAGP